MIAVAAFSDDCQADLYYQSFSDHSRNFAKVKKLFKVLALTLGYDLTQYLVCVYLHVRSF